MVQATGSDAIENTSLPTAVQEEMDSVVSDEYKKIIDAKHQRRGQRISRIT